MESKSVSEPPTASEEFREIEVGDDDDPEHQSAANKASDDGNDDVGVGLTEHETETELDENNGADATAANQLTEDTPFITRLKAVIVTYAPLGFLAFGGPQAHVALLRDRLVVQEKWLDDEAFTELFAIGQGLPGPTSTQLVISTAMLHAGPIGGVVALFLFSLPGLIVLITCGVLIATFLDPNKTPWYLVGLPPAAVSLVFQAFYGFGKNLDKLGIILCLISTQISLLIDGDETIPKSASQYVYPTMLAIGGIISYIDSRRQNPYGTYKSPGNGWDAQSDLNMKRIGIPLWVGAVFIAVWAIILVTTITIVNAAQREGRTVNVYLEIFELMYRVGTLIFGGGQVVLPMLGEEVIPGWMTESQFLQGFGISQSMPGPLFNFSAYVGAVYQGLAGGLVAWLGMFGPGTILIFGVVPFWAHLRQLKWFKSVLNGVNAAAIGLIGAACVILYEGAVNTMADAMVFVLAGTLCAVYGVSAPLVIIAGGIFGAIL
ncbi:hypothetical protein ACHAXH_001311, partial [Discostella pseudostelligera]